MSKLSHAHIIINVVGRYSIALAPQGGAGRGDTAGG